MLLIHPPVAKPSEPPAGIACLAGVLKAHNIPFTVWDGNVESLLYFLNQPAAPFDFERDTWTRRAWRSRLNHLDVVRNPSAYSSLPRYRRAVGDLDRILRKIGEPWQVRMGLGNYEDPHLSPARSPDLLQAAERPEKNPFHNFFRSRLLGFIRKKKPRRIGLSLNFLNQALPSFAIMGFLKKQFPEIPLFLGGGLVTSWVRRPDWRNPFGGLVDELIAGPGEIPLLSVFGAEPKAGGHYLPEFDPFPLNDYLSPGFILPYGATRGCYWNRCLFCPERAEGNPYLAIPPDQVVADLSGLVEKYKPILVHLLDNAVSPVVLERLAKNPIGAPWYGFARFTHHLAEFDFCRELKRSGCAMLQLGVESGDQSVLDHLEKGIDLEIASQALKNLHRAGIAAYVYLLFGTPRETLREARKTLTFTARHRQQISFLNLALFNLPLPGDGNGDLNLEKFSEGDLSLYTGFVHPRGWHRNEVRRFLDKEFRRHPAIADILRRDPPIFTSNHAAFF